MESGKLLLSLCFFFILGLAKAQDMRLLEYADKMNERYLAVKVKTDKIADSLSIIKRVDDGKSVIQLSHFVDGFPRFRATSNINAAATTSTSAVWPGGAARLNLTGTGITLGIWDEGKARIDHQEFGGRVIVKDDSPYISNHATHVSGTMVASGVVPTAKGMSYQANLNSYDWNNDVSEMAAAAAYGLQVSNHSWGYLAGWHYGYAGDNKWVWFGDTTFSRTIDYGFGAYEQTSYDWDTLAWMAPDFLIVKASSNDRYQGPSEQPVQHWLWNSGNGWVLSSSVREKDGENGFDCIPWNGVAKNILTIGAVNDIPAGYQAPSDVVLAGFSSTGPTDDGRIKPDLVANGVDVYSAYSSSSTVYGSYSGTSMATPNTSGSIGLILEHQRNLTGSTLMRAATMKALLIHTADEAGTTTGPDYTYGWGLLNTKKAALLMSRNSDNGFNFNIRELTLSQGDTIKIPVYTNGIEPLSATMVWTDRPSIKFTAFVNDTSHMLVNDLDLRLINTSLQKYYPWKLKGSTPASAATKGDNIVDNVEKVDAGNTTTQETWYVQITHKGTLVGGQQDFSLVLSGISSPPVTSTWNGVTNNEWYTVSNWSDGVPGSNTDIVIPSGKPYYPTISRIAICNNMTIESGASLLDNGLLTVKGIAIVKSAISGSAWHLISAPVSNAVSGMFVGKYLQKHDESTNAYSEIISGNEGLIPAKGYALWHNAGFEATYSGNLNTGNKSFSIYRSTNDLLNSGWNLAGNPYPSTIDWDGASGWTKDNVNDAIYFEKNGDWATYVGGVGTLGGSRYIASGQGFFVSATNVGPGTIGMSDGVRVHNEASFFKNTKTGNLVRIEISGNGYTDEAVVRFIPQSTNEFDGAFDAIKLFGFNDESAQIYTLGSIPLTINAILPGTKEVILGIRAKTDGKYTIASTEINDLKYVTLYDIKTGIYTDLAAKPYTFSFQTGENEQRFRLLFNSPSEIQTENIAASIYSFHQTLHINLKDQLSGDIFVYNTADQIVAVKYSATGASEINVTTPGIYIVKVITEKELVVKKVWTW